MLVRNRLRGVKSLAECCTRTQGRVETHQSSFQFYFLFNSSCSAKFTYLTTLHYTVIPSRKLPLKATRLQKLVLSVGIGFPPKYFKVLHSSGSFCYLCFRNKETCKTQKAINLTGAQRTVWLALSCERVQANFVLRIFPQESDVLLRTEF